MRRLVEDDRVGALYQVIGDNIRRRRKAHKMTLRQVASSMGCSVSLLSQAERAECRVSICTLLKIADILGVHLTDFFCGSSTRVVP